MFKILGFIAGSLTVGITLYVIADSPQIVEKASNGTLTQQDLKIALDQSKSNLEQSIKSVSKQSQKTPPEKEEPIHPVAVVAQSADPLNAESEQEKEKALVENSDPQNLIQPASPQITESKEDKNLEDIADKTIQQAIEKAQQLAQELKSSPFPTAPLSRSKQPQTTKPIDTDLQLSPEIIESTTAIEQPESADNWYPVWDGFRSEISAKGFSRQLAKQSGRELRVERITAGRYQVQMRFQDENDLQNGLQQIGVKTGLNLSERTL